MKPYCIFVEVATSMANILLNYYEMKPPFPSITINTTTEEYPQHVQQMENWRPTCAQGILPMLCNTQ